MRRPRLPRPIRRASAPLAAIAIAATLAGGCGSSSDPTTSTTQAGGGATSNVSATTGAGTANPAPVQGPYNPPLDPANFTTRIDNRYFPLKPGTTTQANGFAEDGTTPQVDTSTVTNRTKRILGIDCVVVRDEITSQGTPVELTYDWYAQDRAGNVWYFGEDSNDYKSGHWVKNDGSWQAGVNGAQPGILMEAHPTAGDEYRQEFYPGHALDQARVDGSGGTVKVPYRTFNHTLSTTETTALEPGIQERKYYAPGIGEIASRDISGGSHESFQLVSVKG